MAAANQNEMAKVSILMAVYNAAPFLEKALQSVLNQTLGEWQLICVDDASTDDSLTILNAYAAKDARIQLIHKDKNEGQAVARNEALQWAKGAYVTMLDADDWLSEDCLQSAVKCFTEDTDAVVLQLMEYRKNAENGEESEKLYPCPYNIDDVISGQEAFEASLDWQLHGLYVVRRELHERYPYDTTCHLYSDDNTTRLHYLHSKEVRFCKGTYYYRKHEGSCTNAMSADRFLVMRANLSMRDTLIKEGVKEDILRFYEHHRWLNYINQRWLYFQHHALLSAEEKERIQREFREVYDTFEGQPEGIKFGYIRFKSYPLFQLQEWAYFSLKGLLKR